MIYEYYTPVYSEEHMVTAKEIAELSNIEVKEVRKIMNEYYNNNTDKMKYFYHGGKGLTRVYPICFVIEAMGNT